MAQIIDIRDAKTSAATTVYDPTCGSGSLLLKVGDEAGTVVTLYGQEKDAATSSLARMNMILHDNPTALIVQGNTLADPKFKVSEPDATQRQNEYDAGQCENAHELFRRLVSTAQNGRAPFNGLFIYCIDQPWLTIRDWPVNALELKPAKKTAASATSSTVVNSPSTVSFSMMFLTRHGCVLART
jgi:hypothetical protein